LKKITWDEWKPAYERIVARLGINRDDDAKARDEIAEIVNDRNKIHLNEFEEDISDGVAAVFGGGPSLDEDLVRMKHASSLFDKIVKIAADGATTGLLNARIVPDIVVTDLDGEWKDLVSAHQKNGSKMVVHSHGDNRNLIERVGEFEKFLATTQVEEAPDVWNFGGFTDGDRAAFFAFAFEPKVLILAGMDLGNKVGKYSRIESKSVGKKLLKLEISKELLSWLSLRPHKTSLFNATSRGEKIPGFPNAAWESI
jgi:uncharacterized Rossmann fold enzyme